MAGWTVCKLLEQGYEVRTTVRSQKKQAAVVNMLEHEGVNTGKLSFAVADLTQKDGWDQAMEGVDYVLHVASPLGGNNHEDETLIPTAKAGAENVIGAAIRAGVKKVVMTSSEAANYPDKKDPRPDINEGFWTDMDNKWLTNYMRSKVVAEKTAWDIINKQSQNLAGSHSWSLHGRQEKQYRSNYGNAA
ncbi:NAD(P)H-binding [Ligilactobacillus sp. WC1T17]|uniref:NAD(P)H-binding n=1 Tax=Ligilactobacillus ruminis TaxID=1623 RepID=A0ABY1AA02_9LACO|nr:NAD(P)H-binding [Ligilactobacillus ruminis]